MANNKAACNSVGFIYARSDSKRLPGKIFKSINGFTLLEIVFSRAQRSMLDEVYLVTSDRKIDDQLCGIADDIGLRIIRGNCNNVIDRTLLALSETNANRFARINGDSPLLEPGLINTALRTDEDCSFVSNLFRRRSPYGVSVELINRKFFESTVTTGSGNINVEHITSHLYAEIANQNYYEIRNQLDHSHMKFVIDEPNEFEELQSILGQEDPREINYWDIVGCEAPVYDLEPATSKND